MPYTNNKYIQATHAIGNPDCLYFLCKTVLRSLENLKNNLDVINTQFLSVLGGTFVSVFFIKVSDSNLFLNSF